MNIFDLGSTSAESSVRDAKRISTSDLGQLVYFAAVNGIITEQQARELIQKPGDSLAVLVKEARKLRELG